jgi:hypothetical protein
LSILALLGATLVGIVNAAPAQAITTVDCNAAGYTPGDLQAAITAETPGGTVNVTGTCTERVGIQGNLTLAGSGAATTTINGGGTPGLPVIFVFADASPTVNISGLTVTGGNSGVGAGVDIFLSGGVVTITDSVISGNTATARGGGIFNDSWNGVPTLNLVNSTVSGNNSPDHAGGLWSDSILNITNSTVSGNTATNDGGGVYNSGGTVTVTGSTIGPDNTAHQGGGIFSTGGSGVTTLTDSTVIGNTAVMFGGGVHNDGSALVTSDSTISGNTNTGNGAGAGIFNLGLGTVDLTNVTVSGNSADQWTGGGIGQFGASLNVTNSTITNNSSGGGGGGGLAAGATTTLRGTIIAGNTAAVGAPECLGGGSITTSGYNLIGDGTDCAFPAGGTGDQVGTGVAPIDAKLGPLADNGSPFTHALLQGSPAINAIPPASCVPATDERGVSRPQGANCDIGAYEATPAAAVADTYSVPQLGTLTVAAPGILGNDTDAEGDTLTAVKASDPTNGTLTLLANGGFTYKPNGAFTGTDTFTYRAFDATGGSNIATVTINVTPLGHDVGLVDVTTGKWYLRDAKTGTITTFFYGNPVDLPISGDWNGDGVSTPGLYRQSDGFFYARDTNTQGPANNSCFAGDPSDIPVVGDWDGDGDDNLGIYRPSEQKFYLFTITCTGSPMGAAQIVLGFGNPGDKPVAGDWDGDGVDEVGLHRESTGFFYWRNTLDTGIASGQIFFGDPNDRFVAGDWGTVDGVDTPAIFRPSDLKFYFRHTLTQGVADSEFAFPGAGSGWLPVSGIMGLS